MSNRKPTLKIFLILAAFILSLPVVSTYAKQKEVFSPPSNERVIPLYPFTVGPVQSRSLTDITWFKDVKAEGGRLLVDFDHNGVWDNYFVKGIVYDPYPVCKFSSQYGACEKAEPSIPFNAQNSWGCLYPEAATPNNGGYACNGPQQSQLFVNQGFHPVYNRADVDLAGDMALIASMGVNTIRTVDMASKALLDAADAAGLKVIAGFWVPYDNGMGSPLDFSNPTVRTNLTNKFVAYVEEIKNHPALLMFAIGQENNYHLQPLIGAKQSWYSLVNEMARQAHLGEDPSYGFIRDARFHPVAIVNGEIDDIGSSNFGTTDTQMSHLDIWGANVYRNYKFIGGNPATNVFDEYAVAPGGSGAPSNKPFLITEFGADAFNGVTQLEDGAYQALWNSSLWDTLSKHCVNATAGAHRVAIGGIVSSFSDNWWKEAGAFSPSACTHENTGVIVTNTQPDHEYNSEWAGVVSVTNSVGNHNPDTKTPRPTFTTLQKRFQCIPTGASTTVFYAGADNGKSCDGTQSCCTDSAQFSLGGACVASCGCAPVANFTASPSSGNAPLSVNFTDTSVGTPTSWAWNFGDGTTSTLQNPSHTYSTAGTYTVALTVTNGCGTNTKTSIHFISANIPCAPVASFSATPTSGNIPLVVNFTDTSTNTPNSWVWDFGDGTTSTSQNPSHTYSAAGTYNVSLTVSNGCGFNTVVYSGFVVVTNPACIPAASFSATPTSGNIPLTVNFTDTSTNTPTSWLWNFGDGTTSTLQNPSHTYTTAGTYNVSLTVSNGCGSNGAFYSGFIVVNNPACIPAASFSATPTSGNIPLAVNFTDTSTNTPTSWAWDFGDGTTSTLQNPSHTYTTAGTYNVSLTVSNGCGSNGAYYSGFVVVNNPTCMPATSFTATPTSGNMPLNVNFTDTSTNTPTSWIWDFGDGNTSTQQNPSHTYAAAGTYNVSLTAGNGCGANTVVYSGYVVVNNPTCIPAASFTATPTSGNMPLTVNFTDTSTNIPTSWAWDFGDGTTSTLQNPSHTYTAAGTYNVSLTVSNGCGSNGAYYSGFVVVNNPACIPAASFSATPTSGNIPLSVNFTDTSTNTPTSWLWNFGDGTTSTLQNPSHTYTTAGVYNVSLNVSNGCGSNGAFYSNYIVVNNPACIPAASFSATPTSGNIPLAVNFTDTSTNTPTSWAWNFGDGGTSTLQNPSHTYAAPGTYNVSLNVSNGCGSNGAFYSGYIVVTNSACAPTVSFSATPTSGNIPLAVNFTDTSTNAPTSWTWNFGDGGTSTLQNPSHTYTSAGVYSVSLTAGNGCGSNGAFYSGYVTVNNPACMPAVSFTATPTNGNAPLTVNFTDTSTNTPTSWSWNFGDGNTSTQHNPSHTYASPGTYNVTLTAGNGCGSSGITYSNYIVVN